MSDPKGRDIKMDQFTLSFHGRLLIEGAEIALNYGQRYGLLGENGSGKVMLTCIINSVLCLLINDNMHEIVNTFTINSRT